MPLLIPKDALAWTIDYLKALLPTQSPVYTVGSKVPLNADGSMRTPTRFVRVEWVGGLPDQRVADRAQVRLQVWGPNGVTDDAERTRVARRLSAFLRRDLRFRRVSGIVSLPDPTDQNRAITQFTGEALTIGEQE